MSRRDFCHGAAGRRHMHRGAPIVRALLCLVVLLPGCNTPTGSIEKSVSPGMPPLAHIEPPATYLTPRSQRFRLAVLAFVERTSSEFEVADSIADMLTTALYATDRFDVYDRRDFQLAPESAAPSAPPAQAAETEFSDLSLEPTEPATAPEPETLPPPFGMKAIDRGPDPEAQYVSITRLRAADGILQGWITGITTSPDGGGEIEADYRIVNPDTGLVIVRDRTLIRFSTDASRRSISLSRTDVDKLAHAIAAVFVDPAALVQTEIRVTDVRLDEGGATVTLDAGSDQLDLRRGVPGFVVEEDPTTHVVRYLAKFVIVGVFPKASVGLIVPHCNSMQLCRQDDPLISASAQLGNVEVGAHARLK